MARARPVKPEALEAYHRGKYLFHHRSPGSLHKAIESFESAIRLDPDFAPARGRTRRDCRAHCGLKWAAEGPTNEIRRRRLPHAA